MHRTIPIVFLLFLGSQAWGQPPGFVRDSLDGYIARGMFDWQIPGMAVLIVKDGKVVLMRGYGVANRETGEVVNEKTLFLIASNTKLFTATALSQLNYDKRISLDDPYTKYFPDFRLYDPTSTRLVTIRDLLCHRIGTRGFAGDFSFWNSRLSASEVVGKMRLIKGDRVFRQSYGYCNSCFLAAGQVIPNVTGLPWASYVRDSLLAPLQMQATFFSPREIPVELTLAKPYTTSFSPALVPTRYDRWDNLAPAAAIISNLSDLSHWLLFQLDGGRYGGGQVVPSAVLDSTRNINIYLTRNASNGLPTHFIAYGLGVMISDYNGRRLYGHTGGSSGMVSSLCFVPEERLGIVILSNKDDQDFCKALQYQLLDAYLGVSYVNRSEGYLKEYREDRRATLSAIDGWMKRVGRREPPLPLAAYAGVYANALYGTINIGMIGKHLVVRFNEHDSLTARLDYMDNGEWLLKFDNVEYGVFATRFKVAGDKVVSVETKQSETVEYGVYEFRRSPTH